MSGKHSGGSMKLLVTLQPVRKKRAMKAGTQLTFYPFHRMMPPTIRAGLPTTLTTLDTHRHTKRFLSLPLHPVSLQFYIKSNLELYFTSTLAQGHQLCLKSDASSGKEILSRRRIVCWGQKSFWGLSFDLF